MENGPHPVHNPLGVCLGHGGPIDKDKGKGPSGQDPADGAAHADNAEFVWSILHVGEGDGVGNGDRRDIEEAMDQHEPKEGPKLVIIGAAEDC